MCVLGGRVFNTDWWKGVLMGFGRHDTCIAFDAGNTVCHGIKKNTIDLIWVQIINKSYTGHNLELLLHICLLHSSELILPYSFCSLYHKSFSFISLLYHYCWWFSRDSQLDWDLSFENSMSTFMISKNYMTIFVVKQDIVLHQDESRDRWCLWYAVQ